MNNFNAMIQSIEANKKKKDIDVFRNDAGNL